MAIRRLCEIRRLKISTVHQQTLQLRIIRIQEIDERTCVERADTVGIQIRAAPAHLHRDRLHRVCEHERQHRIKGGRRRDWRCGERISGTTPAREVFTRFAEHLLGLHIAGDDQRRVIWNVPLAIQLLEQRRID